MGWLARGQRDGAARPRPAAEAIQDEAEDGPPTRWQDAEGLSPPRLGGRLEALLLRPSDRGATSATSATCPVATGLRCCGCGRWSATCCATSRRIRHRNAPCFQGCGGCGGCCASVGEDGAAVRGRPLGPRSRAAGRPACPRPTTARARHDSGSRRRPGRAHRSSQRRSRGIVVTGSRSPGAGRELRPAWRGRGAWRGWRCCAHCGALLHFWRYKLRCPRPNCKLAGRPTRPVDTDALAAALRDRERAIVAAWKGATSGE